MQGNELEDTRNDDRKNDDDMDVTTAPADRKSRAGSDASSDWDDWADAMVAQGERPAEAAATGAAAGGSSPTDGYEDDEWVRTMMEQPSVVLGADNHVWDYVLQMVVEEGEVGDAPQSHQSARSWHR